MPDTSGNEQPDQRDDTTIRQKLYLALNHPYPLNRLCTITDWTITILICLNLAVLVLETVTSINMVMASYFSFVESFTIGLFTIEYGLRIWVAPEGSDKARPARSRLLYIVSFFGLVDLIAILPFYADLMPGFALSVSGFRAVRFLWLLKLARHSRSVRAIGRAFYVKRQELGATAFLMIMLMLLASSAMHYAEGKSNPEDFGSIPKAMWWSIITLTTVGYGDVVPTTIGGKIVGAFVAVLGVAMFALPTAILGAAFFDEMQILRSHRGRTKPPDVPGGS
jgi:voltage-gated potassium channel